VGIWSIEIHICACLWENRGTKIYSELKLGNVERRKL
jgi:hypothetical protein